MSYLEYLRPLKEMMQPLPEPMVLLGDWNATPEMVAALTQQELFDLFCLFSGHRELSTLGRLVERLPRNQPW